MCHCWNWECLPVSCAGSLAEETVWGGLEQLGPCKKYGLWRLYVLLVSIQIPPSFCCSCSFSHMIHVDDSSSTLYSSQFPSVFFSIFEDMTILCHKTSKPSRRIIVDLISCNCKLKKNQNFLKLFFQVFLRARTNIPTKADAVRWDCCYDKPDQRV